MRSPEAGENSEKQSLETKTRSGASTLQEGKKRPEESVSKPGRSG